MPKTDQLTEIAPCVHTYSWVKIGKFILRVTLMATKAIPPPLELCEKYCQILQQTCQKTTLPKVYTWVLIV